MQTAALVIAVLAFLAFAQIRLKRYLHIFQQEEYDGPRFLGWMVRSAAIDKRLTAALGMLTLAFAAGKSNWPITVLGMFSIALLVTGMLEPDPEKAAKKKLAMTQRATRIHRLALALSAVLAAVLVGFSAAGAIGTVWTLVAIIVGVQLIPFILVAANGLLAPLEKHIQDGFRIAAENRLRAVGPKVVGITGSFGKTSVKHILGHVLQMTTNTLYTPGSVNTVMGISRIINERLQDNCRYFIVEMGAYGPGSIARLCRFTPPDHGIITSIGAAHYERFKTLDTVARAKFELAEAVTDRDGKLVIHESVLDQPYARSFVDGDRKRFVVVGESPAADIRIVSVDQKRDGLHVVLDHDGEMISLFAPLFGAHHGHNMALSYAFAVGMGIKPAHVIQAMRSTPQVTHRLELKGHPSGALYLDDAYNSNPQGFSNALDLLDQLRQDGGRRILVTPGVAELGAKHDDVHRTLGTKAAAQTDVTIVVKPERIASFSAAFRAAGTSAELIEVEKFADAQAWLNANLGPKDVVLIENDLPDLYEQVFVA